MEANVLGKTVVEYAGRVFEVSYGGPSTRDTIREIFSKQEYPFVDFIKDVDVIVDIGANIGIASLYFHCIYPNADIFSFEPDLGAFSLLTMNTEKISNIHRVNAACSDYDGEAVFHRIIGIETGYVGNSIHGTGFVIPGHNDLITIKIFNTCHLLRKNGISSIDILKIDTEGCDVQVLRSIISNGLTSRIIYIESHSSDDFFEIHKIISSTHVLWISNYRGMSHMYIDRKYINILY
ncbi:MAG: FkbM family methyltransferase [Magnetococcales bacterium]|nr:FkbM family methyltransferase [Magnetococcales bacterium]